MLDLFKAIGALIPTKDEAKKLWQVRQSFEAILR